MIAELRASRRWALPPISPGGRAYTLDLGMRTLKIPFPLCPRDENGSASYWPGVSGIFGLSVCWK